MIKNDDKKIMIKIENIKDIQNKITDIKKMKKRQ